MGFALSLLEHTQDPRSRLRVFEVGHAQMLA